jgi:hypothetical protein
MRQKLRLALLPLVVLAAALFVVSPAVAAKPVTVVAHINGGGTSVMTDLPAGMGVSSFGFEATLYSDGSATGHFDCVDHVGDVPGYPGNIFGAITGWSQNADGTVNLEITDGKLVNFPASGGGGLVVPGGLPFTVTIQSPGGAGVGHWTLDVPGVVSPFNGGPICQELMVSGQISVRWN